MCVTITRAGAFSSSHCQRDPPKTFTPLLQIRSDPFFVLDAPTGGTPMPPHQLDSEFSDPPPTWLVWVDAWAHSQQG